MTISEPNTILEINDAHSDNFLLVIPKLPTAYFLGSVFNELTKEYPFVTPGTTGTSGNPDDCDATSVEQRKQTVRRERNLDIKNFKLYISEVSMPGVNITKIEVPTELATLSRSGKIGFTDLETTMMISENFLNYNVILYWLYAMSNPLEFNKFTGRELINTFMTDIYLIITNNNREKVAEFKFMDAFPTTLPPLPFSYKNAEKLNVNVTWAHSGMYPTNNFVLKFV